MVSHEERDCRQQDGKDPVHFYSFTMTVVLSNSKWMMQCIVSNQCKYVNLAVSGEDFSCFPAPLMECEESTRGQHSEPIPPVLEPATVVVSFEAYISSSEAMLVCVMRDATNSFLKAKVIVASVLDPCSVEALACLTAIKFALDAQTSKLVVLGDYKVIINNLSSDAETPWRVFNIFQSSVDGLRGVKVPLDVSLDVLPLAVLSAFFAEQSLLRSPLMYCLLSLQNNPFLRSSLSFM
ncbi:hypothetical protein Ancab_036680 [Ancistrocladus abbreviatus]